MFKKLSSAKLILCQKTQIHKALTCESCKTRNLSFLAVQRRIIWLTQNEPRTYDENKHDWNAFNSASLKKTEFENPSFMIQGIKESIKKKNSFMIHTTYGIFQCTRNSRNHSKIHRVLPSLVLKIPWPPRRFIRPTSSVPSLRASCHRRGIDIPGWRVDGATSWDRRAITCGFRWLRWWAESRWTGGFFEENQRKTRGKP